jgi:hypothetical protein
MGNTRALVTFDEAVVRSPKGEVVYEVSKVEYI